MKKDEKYYGKVWFSNNQEDKRFGVLSFINDDIIIETNLHSNNQVYKESLILGVFTGLGYLTFIDCRIKLSSSGIAEARVYIPKYSFVSDSCFVNISNLKFKKFKVINDAIVKWINNAIWYDSSKDELVKTEFIDDFLVDPIGLKISIQQYLHYKMEKRSKLVLSNIGCVKFELKDPICIITAIELYDEFQKILQLTFGGSSKFSNFSFKFLDKDEWVELYYNDKKLSTSSHSFGHTNYKEVSMFLPSILKATYSNKDFKFCLDKLMENFIGKHPSHNKRFTNSIAAFEAFCKLFSENPKNKLAKSIIRYENVFKKISGLNDNEWKKFPSKVVRSRDFHVHSNLGNKDVFSEFDLLYISFLLDFVIAYLLLSQLEEIQESFLDKYVRQGNRVFVDMKRTNAILRGDSFNL